MNCNLRFLFIALIFLVIPIFSLLISCKWKDKGTIIKEETGDITRGEILARDYCQRCHLFPSPELLDKKTWIEGVLPNMAWRLGIRENGSNPYADLVPQEEKIIRKLGVYPEATLIPHSDWLAIKKFYEELSPSQPLPQKKEFPHPALLSHFATKLINFENNPLPQTTLLKYDKHTSQLFVGDAKKNLYILNTKFKLKESWQTDSAPTDIDFPKKGKPRLLTIGDFNPSDQKNGRLATMDTASVLPEGGVFIESLCRPVQFAVDDLNEDKKDDALICGFGNHTGKLAWYDGMNPGKENVLKALPGARCAIIRDMNNDNRPDIVVLMAQAYEQVSIFYNQGKGKFTEKKVLEFPPVYGVIYFELADFNKDGFQDIILTNGDNWDFSTTRKNFHGIRIFLNDSNDNFTEKWFYPMYGACKAIARDFDKDGNLDIAAIAFFSDDEKPENSFVYLSNNGNLDFSPYAVPRAGLGKWLTMEAGDFDRDGDIDLVLGSYFQNLGELSKLVAKGVTVVPQLLILINK
ncbi:FG-GAP repeat domain-containing protein [Terrimonas pollutisoli]|uniref:FG-GAP repeat domain-containing protein n=1 Tax=Terrimonas pollutisoli TaxID=3034147 RepID=UPI0023EBC8C4|nr:VCBS repeat-containing protein [Terrimonas sp. H1YJ31]